MSWLGSDDQVNIKRLKIAIGVCFLGGSATLSAATFEPGAGLGWQYSDNVALTPDDEEVDHGAVGYLGALLTEEGGPLTYSAAGTVTRQLYANSTFDNQTYFNLNARARWEQVDNRLNWLVDDFFTQTPVNSLGEDVPTNIENTNVFSLGPDITFPLSSGHRFRVNPFFRDYYYEDSDTDNQQYGLDAGWSYPMYPTMRIGINAGITDVNYDQSDGDNDYTRTQLRAAVSGSRPHSEYTVDLGTSRVSRDKGNDQTGFGGSLSYLYNITGRSSVRAHAATDLTDSSQTFFDSEVNPDSGNQDNVQTSGDTFRNNVFTLVYTRDDDTFDTRVWGELRNINYDESLNDRKVQEFGADLDYRINAYLGTGVYGSYVKYKETDISRTDKRYILGGRVRYNFSRKLAANVSIQYRNRDSTESASNYNEFSALVGVVYGYVGRTTGLVGSSNIYQY
jgi:hypothetical protein